MTETEVYIGIGSNLGDREGNIKNALLDIAKIGKITRKSSLYETEPMGYKDQPAFLNCVISVDTNIEPKNLLTILKKIEKRLGRENTFKNGPRTIDLDILLYGNRIVGQSDLKIPHPRMGERKFVLTPLREIAPGIADKLLKNCQDNSQITKWTAKK